MPTGAEPVTFTALHTWHVDKGRCRASVHLAEPDVSVSAAFQRRGAPLMFLTELWVPPHVRGAGAARALLKGATDWAEGAGVDLWLYIAPHGPEPRAPHAALARLYRAYGFRRVSPRSADYEMLRRAGS